MPTADGREFGGPNINRLEHCMTTKVCRFAVCGFFMLFAVAGCGRAVRDGVSAGVEAGVSTAIAALVEAWIDATLGSAN